MSKMFNSAVPLIFPRFQAYLRRDNKEKHFLINVHWIKEGGDTGLHRDTTSQPLSGLENNLNHHFKNERPVTLKEKSGVLISLLLRRPCEHEQMCARACVSVQGDASTEVALWFSTCEHAASSSIYRACMCVFTLLSQVCDIISPQSHATARAPHIDSCFINVPAAAESSSLIDSHTS